MAFFRLITRGFIDFFGITQPSEEQERRAAWFICSMMVLILAMASLVFAVVVLAFGKH